MDYDAEAEFWCWSSKKSVINILLIGLKQDSDGGGLVSRVWNRE